MTRERGIRVLAGVTWAYLAWSLAPVVVTVIASLHPDPYAPAIGLDAYRAAVRNPDLRLAFGQSVRLALLTVLVAVPLGGSLGLALAQLGGRPWRLVRMTLVLMVAVPHTAVAIALFTLFAYPLPIRFGTLTQLVGHVTVALPFVALVVWTRLLFLDRGFDEQAADLGAPPMSAIRRVLVPLCAPALIVGALVAFAVSFNEVPLSAYLCIPNECRTLPVMLGGRAIGETPPPALAISVLANVVSLAIFAVGIVWVRGFRTRRDDRARVRRVGPA